METRFIFLGLFLFIPSCFGNRTATPSAVDDYVTTSENIPIAIEVLANDSDVDGSLSRAAVVLGQAPTNGVAVVSGQLIQYSPDADFFGTDFFFYRIRSTTGLVSSYAKVVVDVVEEGDSPIAGNDIAETEVNVSIDIPVTLNDSDPDGDLGSVTVELTTNPSNGVAIVDGQIVTYTPDLDYVGPDSFEYRLKDEDGLYSNQAEVAVTVNAALSVEDLGGVWVGVFVETGGDKDTGYARFRADGSPDEFFIGEDYYDLSNGLGRATFEANVNEFTVTWGIPTIFYRVELVGTLDNAREQFSGSWGFWNTYDDDVNASHSGTFLMSKSPVSAARELSDLSGSWSGTMSFPDHGISNFDAEFDNQGAFVAASVDGFRGSGVMPLVLGLGQIVDANRGLYAFEFVDRAQEQGSGDDVIQMQGVLPEGVDVWSGIVEHYFWGSGSFYLERP